MIICIYGREYPNQTKKKQIVVFTWSLKRALSANISHLLFRRLRNRKNNPLSLITRAPLDIHHQCICQKYLTTPWWWLLLGACCICIFSWLNRKRYQQLSQKHWCHHKRYCRQHFYEDMDWRSSSIFEWVTHTANAKQMPQFNYN